MPNRGHMLDLSVRIFDVECECGREFRVSLEVGKEGARSSRGFLVEPSGRCPHCGLELGEIEPFTREDRSRA